METTAEEFEERRRLLLQIAEAYANLFYIRIRRSSLRQTAPTDSTTVYP